MTPIELLSPSDAQEQYDLTGSLLRRYALIYENLGGSIPRDKRGGRMYTREVLEHFVEASQRVQDGATVEDALKTLTADPGELVAPEAAPALGGEALKVLKHLLSTQEALLEEVKELRSELTERAVSRSELEELRRDLHDIKDVQRETLLESAVSWLRRKFTR